MIPFAKPIIDEEEFQAVRDVLETGMLAEGKISRELEKEFAEFTGVKHATVTSNGTTALSTALEAIGIQPGDEVITTPFTFIASANSIAMLGAIPVFVDIDPETYNIDPDLIEKAITDKTRAIMPVHIFGNPSDMDRIMEIAEAKDVLVIEDACQAHAAEFDGKKVGSIGHISAFSFYATKNMMTGEGGMITTNNEEYYDEALMIKNHGRGKHGGYSHFRIGYNNRMMDIVSALCRVQLKRLPSANKARRSNGERYNKLFADFDEVVPQTEPKSGKSSYHLYAPTFKTLDRDDLVKKLREEKIGSRAVYALPCHKQDTYLDIQSWRWAKYIQYPDYSKMTFPVSEKIGATHLDIPVHPQVTDSQMEHIEEAFKRILS
ncbi:MAG: DegT/DnrJ/EryC1/StrS family aminotransferase [Candidatus Thorarchaeota archaeon]